MRYLTVESAKEGAPLDALCAHLGIVLGPDDHALCPFHEDRTPSFYLWDDGHAWWCQVCGFGGDQIELLRRYKGLGFSAALAELDRLADELPDTPPRVRRARDPEADLQALYVTVADARERARHPGMDGYMSVYGVGFVDELTAGYRFAWDAHLRDYLGWGVDDLGRVVMPHWDGGGRLTGAKLRAPDGSRFAVPGSTFDSLYMSWVAPAHDAVLLCEGETDCAWASYHSLQGFGVDVRGLPGANTPLLPEMLLHILSRWPTAFVAFDPDEAGYAATERWCVALHEEGHGDVRTVRLPEGSDLRTAGIPLAELLS